MKREYQKAAKRYAIFNGKAPDKIGRITPPKLDALVYLGKAVAVEYASDKPLRGSRKMRVFRHKIGQGVKVYTDPSGRWVFIVGGKFRVTDWLRD